MFGILHGLENQREALARVCRSEYPKLEAELWALETKENRGVLALLLDTLVDLELIKEQATRPSPPYLAVTRRVGWTAIMAESKMRS